MGPSRTREQTSTQTDIKALLRDKDDRIAMLETRLEAYSARASTAHTRLLKTIDVLDALRSQHTLEISSEEQEKMKLIQEVDRWRLAAKNVEVEKDELKDVVEDLIEKVQVSNEWSSWPCSRMHITKHAEQVAAGAPSAKGTSDDYNNDLLAYATSMITRLRTELDLERQSHRRTAEEANLRIEELEAKVAVRESELEDCIASCADHEHQPEKSWNILTQSSEKWRSSTRLLEPKPLTDEECLYFLESNHARNRSLELEIRHIVEKLEQARMGVSPSSSSRNEPRPLAPGSDHKTISTRSPRTRSASVDPNALSRPLDTGKTPPVPSPASSSMTLSIAQLDNQIRTMTTQVDALVSERTTLIEAAARKRRVTDGINIDTFQDVLRVEGECVRLQAEVDDLREQLQHARTFAREREKVLLREIARLRASESGPSALHLTYDSHYLSSLQPLEGNIAIEESMELASPLMPTVAPNPDPPLYDSDVEVDLLSFPFSPQHVSSPTPNAPLTPRTTDRGPDSQGIERVPAALDATQMHLIQGEEALSQLYTEMESLPVQAQTQTGQDEDEDGG